MGKDEATPLDELGDAARGEAGGSTDRVLTVPNLISLTRILLIPLVVWLLIHRETAGWGILLLAILVGTDWIDGRIARRYNQVSELGKLLDPTADRLIIAAGLISLVIVGAFPLWAALLVIVRDVFTMSMWVLLLKRHLRIDVRYIGKAATFMLMAGIPLIAWGSLDLPLGAAASAIGWMSYAVGVVEYYIAAYLYIGDVRQALDQQKRGSTSG
ncbi:MAG: CDP-alcohol phosphatidyltransferase family protein [Actinomycetota bacterium]